MGEKRNFAALDWVIGEIDETLKDARQALEAYVEDTRDSTRIRFCLTHIHQVYGSLQMVEFHGASLLAEEMEQLAQAIMNNTVASANEAHEVLMRSLLQLPIYLDHVKARKEDQPGVVLPLLNDLRAVRKQSYLSETNLFSPDLSVIKTVFGHRHPVSSDKAKLTQVLKKLREMYQFAAAGVLRGIKIDENLGYLDKVCSRMELLTQGTACYPLWEVSAALIDAVRREDVELSVAVRGLLRYLARELRILGDKVPAALDALPRESLLKNLLYYVARAKDGSSRVEAVKQRYQLTSALLNGHATGADVDSASLSAPDPDAIRSVIVAINDEISTIRNVLDASLSSGIEPSTIGEVLPIVKRVADTLAVLGIGDLRKQVVEQHGVLETMAKANAVDNDQLLLVASKIVEIEQRLEAISKVVGSHRDLANIDQRAVEIDQAKTTVIKECQHGLEQIKDAIIAYHSSKWDKVQLQNVGGLLINIRGGLEMIPLRRPAAVLDSCNRYIQEELLEGADHPTWSSLETLADAITSIEYFLERLLEDVEDEDRLEIAEKSVAALSYPVTESIAPAQPTPAPAKTAKVVDLPLPEAAEPAVDATKSIPEPRLDFDEDNSGSSFGQWQETKGVSSSTEPENEAQTPAVEKPSAQPGPSAAPAADSVVENSEEKVKKELPEAVADISTKAPEPKVVAPVIVADREDSDIDEEIIEIFIEEAGEVSETLAEYFPQWSSNLQDQDALVVVRRAFHTLKGSGRMVEALDIGELAWSVENMLNRIIDNTIAAKEEHINFIDRVLALLPTLIDAFAKNIANPEKALTDQYQAWGAALAQGKLPPELSAPMGKQSGGAAAAQQEQEEPEEENENLVLWEIFSSEAASHLQTIESFIRASQEEAPLYFPPSDDLQRALHTLKGSAKMAQITPIAQMAEPLETFTKELISYQVNVTSDILQLLRDAVVYTKEGLAQIGTGNEVYIPKIDQFLARCAELRELSVGPMLLLKDQGKEAAFKVDPRFLSIVMAEEMKLLLDAEELLQRWQHHEIVDEDIRALIKELGLLEAGAEQANLPDMANLSRQLQTLHTQALTGQQPLVDDFFDVVLDGHNQLLDMVDRIAAGQNATGPSETITAALDDLIIAGQSAAPLMDVEEEIISSDYAEENAEGASDSLFSQDVDENLEAALAAEGIEFGFHAEDDKNEFLASETLETAGSFDGENEAIHLEDDAPNVDTRLSESETGSSLELAAEANTSDAVEPEKTEVGSSASELAGIDTDDYLVSVDHSESPGLAEGQASQENIESPDLAEGYEVESLELGDIESAGTHDLVEAHDWQPEETEESEFAQDVSDDAAENISIALPHGLSELATEEETLGADNTFGEEGLGLPELSEDISSEETEFPSARVEEGEEATLPQFEAVAASLPEGGLEEVSMEDFSYEFAGIESSNEEGPEDGVAGDEPLFDLSSEEEPLIVDMSEESLLAELAEYSESVEDDDSYPFDEAAGDLQAAAEDSHIAGEDQSNDVFYSAEEESIVADIAIEESDKLEFADLDFPSDDDSESPVESEPTLPDFLPANDLEAASAENDIADVDTAFTEELTAFAEQPSVEEADGIVVDEITEELTAGSEKENAKAVASEQGTDIEQDESSAHTIPGLLDTIDTTHEDFDADILEVFLEEAEEIIEDLDEAVHVWESDWTNQSSVEEIKRALHTLKGGARLAGMMNLGELTHEYESHIIGLKLENVDQQFFRSLHGYQDRVLTGVRAIQTFMKSGVAHAAGDLGSDFEFDEPVAESAAPDNAEFDAAESAADSGDANIAEAAASEVSVRPLKTENSNVLPFAARARNKEEGDGGFTMPAIAKGTGGQAAPQVALRKASGPQEVIKVPADLLEELVNLAGETSISRGRIEEQVNDFSNALDEIDGTLNRLQEQLRRLDIETEAQIIFRQEQMAQHEDFDPLEMDRYSALQQLSRSLMESASDLEDLKETLDDKLRDTETLLLQQSRINTTLQEGLMRSRMVPFSRLVPRLRRIVRQVATELGKSVSFELDNIEGELDRSVLERMIPPLEHMLRNAVDHGIEMPSTRIEAGKPEAGRIVLTLGREGGDVLLRLADDGQGINLRRVREKAIERGLMSADAELSDHDITQFILHAGFSTAESVTHISGRGVGMDVVSAEIKQLGGSVTINSEWGKGTEFVVRLPFTVSVNRALMVLIGQDTYAVPLNTIEGIVRVSPYELEHYYSSTDARFEYAGENYQVRYLGTMLSADLRPKLDAHVLPLPVLLVRSAEHTMAVQVDAVMGSREIVVKSLGSQFSLVQGMSGATVMGDGSVVIILDAHALVRKEMALSAAALALLESSRQQITTKAKVDTIKTIMVVDDSVTVRKVTTRFLERQGFNVITAKDGVDALRILQDATPDLMLLDIEMPRMDGFEVAKNVRGTRRWKEIPIIMITSRTGEKHREHAMSLGVNGYLGKPYQEDLLLETMTQLLD